MAATTHAPFALVATDIILLPTPSSVKVQSYRDLFRKLHEDHSFCQVAFGDGWPARPWSNEEIEKLLQADATHRWGVRDMGDFALGFLSEEQQALVHKESSGSKNLRTVQEEIKIVDGTVFEKLFKANNGKLLEEISWAGYTCVRDARDSDDQPDWREMIEVRYGLSPEFRGRGVITRAQTITMRWSVEERGVKRFIGEAQKHNPKSGRVLERIGLHKTDTDYFHDENAEEWASDLQ